jgi:hypothetical protein
MSTSQYQAATFALLYVLACVCERTKCMWVSIQYLQVEIVALTPESEPKWP